MTIKLRSITNIAAIGVVLIAMLVLSACGGDDAPADVNTNDNPGVASQSITLDAPASGDSGSAEAEPTAIPEKDPPEVAVTLKEAPNPGSLQEKILNVFEQQVRAMNTLDYASYLNTCLPGGNGLSEEQLAFAWNELGGEFGLQIANFSMPGYNARGVEFRIYSDDNVRTTFEIFDYDEWVAAGVSRGWEKVGGEWYSTAMSCTGATGRQNR